MCMLHAAYMNCLRICGKKNIHHIHVYSHSISGHFPSHVKCGEDFSIYILLRLFCMIPCTSQCGIRWYQVPLNAPLDSPHPKVNLKTLSSHQNSSSFINFNTFYKPSTRKKKKKTVISTSTNSIRFFVVVVVVVADSSFTTKDPTKQTEQATDLTAASPFHDPP